MRTSRLWQLGALAVVAVLAMGSGCPIAPSIKDREVELAAGGSTTVQFHAYGSINVFSKDTTIDLANDIDLAQILDDAGIDASNIKHVSLAGVSYRVVVPDPTAARQIVNGNVKIGRGVNPAVTPLITNFTETVNSVTSYKTAPLDPAGVAILNGLLNDMLNNVKSGTPVGSTTISYSLSGQSQPSDVTTDFVWEIKLDISVVGTIKVKVIG